MLVQLTDITKEWKALGMALGLEHRVIAETESNHPSDVKECLGKVIEEWLKWKGKEVSWRTMYEALMDPLVSRPDVADKINKDHLKLSARITCGYRMLYAKAGSGSSSELQH